MEGECWYPQTSRYEVVYIFHPEPLKDEKVANNMHFSKKNHQTLNAHLLNKSELEVDFDTV